MADQKSSAPGPLRAEVCPQFRPLSERGLLFRSRRRPGLLSRLSRPAAPWGVEVGMVTVETAFALISLAVVGSFAIAVAGALFVLGACQVTANEVARQEARGDQVAVARAKQDAPRGAIVVTRREAEAVVTEVQVSAALGPLSWPLSAQATVLVERP